MLLDTQFVTDHLKSLGAVEVTRQKYRAMLDDALKGDADFFTLPREISGADALAQIRRV